VQAKPKRPLKSKLIAAAASVAALATLVAGGAVFVGQYIAPFDGPLEVIIVNQPSPNRLQERLYTFVINDEPIQISARSSTFSAERRWRSESNIDVEVKSRFIEESTRWQGIDTFLSVAPRGLGLLGSDKGSVIRVVVTVTRNTIDAQILVEDTLEADGFRLAKETRMRRGNYAEALTNCIDAETRPLEQPAIYAQGIYEAYTEAVKSAQLNGARTLSYSVWASRSSRLQGLISDIEDETRRKGPSRTYAEWSNLEDAIDELRRAWSNLETVSRRQADSQWDAAWQRIYDAETGVETSVRRLETVAPKAKERCTAKLTSS
jgi:hypothetical protein